MGKSPGKWIKTVLFGKKHSKSNFSKNVTPDKKSALKTPAEDLDGKSPVISDPSQFADKGAENIELEKGISGNSSTVNQGLESQNNFVSVPLSDDEMRRRGEAATKAQAVFRGYLARRAFRALKGIIRLQALIRGHLVRRQAVATLRCMQAVIKLQALARGRRVRLSDNMQVSKKYGVGELQVGVGANSIFASEKLATNSYFRKLLLSLPNAMPLSLQYDLAEPNSARNWLERWSLSRFWDPPTRPRKVLNIKPQRKQSGSQFVENEAGKSKRSIRKASIAANGDNSLLASFETDKPKRNPRKPTSHQMESAQEQHQSELERVKRSLRKVSASLTVASEKSEAENNEKPQQQQQPSNVTEDKIVISAENRYNSDVIVDKFDFLEAPSKPTATDDLVDVPHDDRPFVETHSSENGEKMESTPFSHDELSSKEDENGKENREIRKRRSLPVKQEFSENISLNAPSLPSYMAATVSAKAKLRAQGSSKLSEDGTEVGYVRRHSLPASTNGKMSLLSPRIQKRVNANGKVGSSKTNKSMTSSKDDKVLQPGWRR